MNDPNPKTDAPSPEAAPPAEAPQEPMPLPAASSSHKAYFDGLPERYIIKDADDEKVLTCLETPNITVRVKKGLTVTASAARKSPAGTIYLDGAAQGEPFMDHEKQVYNLDHHEGCVRAFTLATCEQVLVMTLKGLDLREREWKVYANEPDLDTLLAIWLIFNQVRIHEKKDSIRRRILLALVRLEGVIDALGLELKELSALPPDILDRTQRIIDYLRTEEVAYKKEGLWEEIDYLEYTAHVLHKIDQIIYKSSDFSDFKGIDELARVELKENRIAAVVAADLGIYELEPHLHKVYGNRLGLVALKTGEKNYTLRQMDLFMPGTLDDVYDRLNFVDPAVKCRNQSNKWGGSADIGGSPRQSGTSLSPQEIAKACRDALKKMNIFQQGYRYLLTGLLAFLLLLAADVVRLSWQPQIWLNQPHLNAMLRHPVFGFNLTLLLLTILFLAILSHRKQWQFGIITPMGKDWWFILPFVVMGGLAGGVWLRARTLVHLPPLEIVVVAILLAPLTSELLFRGLVHGILAQSARIQHCASRLYISWPVIGSALLYAMYALYRTYPLSASLSLQFPGWHAAETFFGAFAFGLAAGMVRERSQSILPAYLFHVIAAACVVLLSDLLF